MNALTFHLRTNDFMISQFMMVSGKEYAIHQWGTEPKFLAQVLDTNTYWRWWGLQFRFRNSKLVHKHSLDLIECDQMVSESVWYLFQEAHMPENITNYPNKTIMELILKEINSKTSKINENHN